MADPSVGQSKKSVFTRFLDAVEWAGNKLPDPAVLFLIALGLTWVMSAILSNVEFTEVNPKLALMADKQAKMVEKKKAEGKELTEADTKKIDTTIRIQNQLTGDALLTFLENMVETFTGFHPLGVVLVAMLGVGVAEYTGFINACLKAMLNLTPMSLLTPMLLVVAIVSHTAGDTGYVLVIPLGGIIFATAGRHPLAGIVCAFAGVSGGFSANFIVSGLDPLLQGITQEAAQIVAPEREVNPLCNYVFMTASSIFIVLVGWVLTDKFIEPKLKDTPLDDEDKGPQPNTSPAPTATEEQQETGIQDVESKTAVTQTPTAEEDSASSTAAGDQDDDVSTMGKLTDSEVRGMKAGLISLGLLLLGIVVLFSTSSKETTDRLMKAIVPMIFLVFLIPASSTAMPPAQSRHTETSSRA